MVTAIAIDAEHVTLEVPRRSWTRLLRSFSRRNLERACKLEAISLEETRVLFDDRPLLEVTLDESQDFPAITIVTGGETGAVSRASRYLIAEPTALREIRGTSRSADVLEIEVRGQAHLVLTIYQEFEVIDPAAAETSVECFRLAA